MISKVVFAAIVALAVSEKCYELVDASECSKPCGCGLRNGTYKILSTDENGYCLDAFGDPVKDGDFGSEVCNKRPCPDPTDGVIMWSECSLEDVCGPGVETPTWKWNDDSRTDPVPDDIQDQLVPRDCSKPCCTMEWSEWSECSAPCGKGTYARTYSVVSDGVNCTEELKVEETCQIKACDFKIVVALNQSCDGEPLGTEFLEDFGEAVEGEKNCRKGATVECVAKCDETKECKGIEVQGDTCCFFATLPTPVFPGKGGDCLRKDIVESDGSNNSWMWLTVLVGGVGALAFLSTGSLSKVSSPPPMTPVHHSSSRASPPNTGIAPDLPVSRS
eukprot:1064764-Amorphochlora_amoeboformis.AAC.2